MNFTVVKLVSLLNIDMGCSVIVFNSSKMSFNTTIFALYQLAISIALLTGSEVVPKLLTLYSESVNMVRIGSSPREVHIRALQYAPL